MQKKTVEIIINTDLKAWQGCGYSRVIDKMRNFLSLSTIESSPRGCRTGQELFRSKQRVYESFADKNRLRSKKLTSEDCVFLFPSEI